MVVCRFFQQGRCRFGDQCKNEHPGAQQQTFTGGNRFGALSGGSSGFNSRSSSGPGQQSKQSQEPVNYGVTVEDIKADLVAGKGRPDWVFSCYGPGRNAPKQLFGGPQREQSFEELRLRHYEAAASGNPGPAIQEAESMYNEAVNQMEVILKNLGAAVKYVVDGGKEHPNRIDITKGDTGPGASQLSAFGQQTPAFQAPGFSQPASSTPAFGQPSFGQPSLGQPSSFGQPSSLGQPSGFGQSSLGQPSGFGQPSALGASSGFGKPAFGQPSQPSQSSFGQPSSMGASPFGQATGTSSPFSQISGPTSGFGQASASPFSQTGSGFGQPSATPASSGFGTPSQLGNPFGQPSAPLGQPSQPTSTPFGAAAPQPTSAPFGLPAGGAPQISQPASVSSGQVGAGPPPLLKTDNTNDLIPIPPLNGATTHNPMSKKLQSWKGQPVQYIDNAPCYLHPQDRKTYVRIFFPDGPPDEASLRDAHAEPDKYTPEVTEQYEFFVKNGCFKDGLIPSVPPKTEWVSFDF
ncbi:hypothetical protein ASPVEDRAFT_195038 [Aspergillus versicolor CBS 583.65]|uniref:C3H1-type domain-containing protein n=1 Tax=Aspergillus versicolor CBS 583.65 TaxID=1036611 RepID=A0A1L9PPY6_ASPVE|nr:uncharacterized protein ASPVEDRAFT_195038 [Aspergillus versicolor CBS 583.65]OJJ03495.1 hypothetical protein ASPVEDRAFT_195038 [Aspergillus versicolor CBS 583.65]